MKILDNNLVKMEIKKLFNDTHDDDIIKMCTYSFELTNVEIFEFLSLIERNITVEIIVGKKLDEKTIKRLSKLFNIRVRFLERLHAKFYLNNSSVIITSCNFGNLNVPRLFECGVRFSKKDNLVEYRKVERQFAAYESESELTVPLLRYSGDKPLNPMDFLRDD